MNFRVLLVGMWLMGAGCGWAAEKAEPTPAEPVKIERVAVQSSNIAEIGYDDEGLILEIAFHKGGVYRYFDVPLKLHKAFMNAENKGTYFRKHIRGKFRDERQAKESPKDAATEEKPKSAD